jgi:hypothetical protein
LSPSQHREAGERLAATARAHAAGWTFVQEGDTFAYFEVGGPTSTTIELAELNDGTRWMNQTVADDAAGWDGITDPIRPLMQ